MPWSSITHIKNIIHLENSLYRELQFIYNWQACIDQMYVLIGVMYIDLQFRKRVVVAGKTQKH